MLLFIGTDVCVSKGFDGKPALRFYETDSGPKVRFRAGKRVYDSRCENNYRYINLRLKASGDVCERIRKMKIKEGSFINITGEYDEEVLTDDKTGETKTLPVINLLKVKFSYGGGGKKEGMSDDESGSAALSAQSGGGGQYGASVPPQASATVGSAAPAPQQAASAPEVQNPQTGGMPENFTGYENFGSFANPFFQP